LQHREGNGIVYASQHMDDAEAEATLMGQLAGEPLATPRRFRFKAGHRAEFWRGNCVALGFASGFLEPLESTGIQLIQNGIGRLIEYFPDRRFDPVVVAEYNRVVRVEWERIRDFIIAHYCVSRRPEPFWQAARAMDIPDTLRNKLDVWRSRAASRCSTASPIRNPVGPRSCWAMASCPIGMIRWLTRCRLKR
jgi:tryptophan halogenase